MGNIEKLKKRSMNFEKLVENTLVSDHFHGYNKVNTGSLSSRTFNDNGSFKTFQILLDYV